MPRKKRTIVEETLPDEPSFTLNPETPEFEDIKYKVYKMNGGEKSFCFQTDEIVDELSLQAQYPNGGKFAVVTLINGSSNGAPDYYTIEPKPVVNAGANGSDDLRVRLLMDELNFTRQMVLKSLENHGQQTPITELIGALQGLHALAPARTDPTELLIKGMELGSKAGGASSDWKSELIHTVKQMAPEVMQTLQTVRRNPPVVQQIENGETPMLPPAMMIKTGIVWIKRQILSGLEPGLAVDWITNNANDVQYQPFLAMAINGTIQDFIALDAELASEPYKSWFETAITMLKDAYAPTTIAPDDSDSANNERGIGNGSNVTTDAKPSASKHNLTKVV